MQKVLSPAERLIVAGDFKPGEKYRGRKPGGTTFTFVRDGVRSNVLWLADMLHGTGVCLKLNFSLRACDYDLVDQVRARGVRVFADLKLFDISETLSSDGKLLSEVSPEMLTVSIAAGVNALRSLKAQLPRTEILGVPGLTSHTDADSRAIFGCPTVEAVMRLARIAAEARLDGLVSAPTEAAALRAEFGTLFSLITPNVRFAGEIIPGDDQNSDRTMTPANAILAGADRIVMGRSIIGAKNPRDAVKRAIDEIASAKR